MIPCENDTKPSRRGFTLIELLVVIAIISLLVSILLPSLQKAKQLAKGVVCQTQLRNAGIAGQFYQQDYSGLWRIYGNKRYFEPWGDRVGWALLAEAEGYIELPSYSTDTPASDHGGVMCPETQFPSDWTSYGAFRRHCYGANFRGNYRGVGLIFDSDLKGFQRFYQNPNDQFGCRWRICVAPEYLERPDETFVLGDTSGWKAQPYNEVHMGVGGVKIFWAPHYEGKANILFADGRAEPVADEDIDELYYPDCGIILD